MTTLTSKFQETAKRLQQLTVWKPSDRDPYLELDRWRDAAHQTIEQIYFRKHEQIEQLIEKHEREFMRQIARQRALLSSIRKRLLIQKEHPSSTRQQLNETSVITDLNKIENDINTRLGRAEIHVESKSFDLDDTILISLKAYLSSIPSMCLTETSTRNQPKKPRQRSANESTRAYQNWLGTKNNSAELTSRIQLQSARESLREADEVRARKHIERETRYREWLDRKKREGAFTKKRTSVQNADDHKDQTNGTV